MPLIKREQIPAQASELPCETVTVEALGGDVLVKGMDLPALMLFYSVSGRASTPLDGESKEQANQRGGLQAVSTALAMGVYADDGLPVFSEAQWRTWGADHTGEAMKLFRLVMKLSGTDAEAERKNS